MIYMAQDRVGSALLENKHFTFQKQQTPTDL